MMGPTDTFEPPRTVPQVLRRNGPKATAYGVHDSTAAVMLGMAAVLLSGPE